MAKPCIFAPVSYTHLICEGAHGAHSHDIRHAEHGGEARFPGQQLVHGTISAVSYTHLDVYKRQLEAVVVTAFWFSGMTMEGTFVSTVLGLVGVGTVVHSMVDYYLALLIWQPVSRAAKLPASFTFSKS